MTSPEHAPKRSPSQRARRANLRADGTPARVTRRRPETRARLLDAAFGVFAARGFGRASIEEVCEAAGYTRGAFYSNFDTLDELFFALYTQRSELLAHHVAAGLTHAPTDLPQLVAQAVQALMVDRDWILVSTDFRLYAARNPEVAAALSAHRNKLRDALATSLAPAIDRSGLPASLRTRDGLARAVMALHDGATTELLLDTDPARFRSWLTDLLTALLDHPRQMRTSTPTKHPATNSP
ncbi:MAG: TetR/AcrR family transcriptional regulator [Solirubrobacteraceae bacterium]